MVRGFILGLVVAAAAIIAAGYFLVTSGAVPANADGPNLPFERYIARASLRATLAKQAPKGPNPVALTDANLVEGVNLYGARCAVCHGSADGKPTAISEGESQKPPIFAPHARRAPDGVLFWEIKHGIRWTGMPAWGKSLDDQQIWTLALFLKHMDALPPKAEAAGRAVKNPEAPPAPSDVVPAPAGQ